MQKNKLLIIKIVTYFIIYILMVLVFYLLHQASIAINPLGFTSIVIYIYPIVMILFGILLNFERIIEIITVQGKITIDWLRLVVIVLPLTVISFVYLLQYSQLFNNIILTYYIRPPVVYVAQFLQGFLLVSCFAKKSNLESSD